MTATPTTHNKFLDNNDNTDTLTDIQFFSYYSNRSYFPLGVAWFLGRNNIFCTNAELSSRTTTYRSGCSDEFIMLVCAEFH